MKNRNKPQVIAPREFFLELNDLFRALEAQNHKRELSLPTQDALARVISWVPHMQHTAIRTLSGETA